MTISKIMKTITPSSLLPLLLIFMTAGPALAAMTPSGTVVTNTATATYDTAEETGLTVTGSTVFTVDNLVNLTVTKNADKSVAPGSTDEELVFVVSNDGNTDQRYALSVVNSDGISMDNVRIYLDDGTNPNEWDAGDTLYVDASTFGDVSPEGTLNVLVVADTPGGASDGDTSDYDLIATTVDAGTTDITIETTGPNTAGVDVVFGDVSGTAPSDIDRDGEHSATGTYTVTAVTVVVTKSVLVYSDPHNGTLDGTAPDYSDCTVCPKAIPGATLRYTLEITVEGSGTALDVVITDPIPADSTYTSDTLTLNGPSLSDQPSDDAGEVGGGPVTVTVRLGDLTSASPTQTITFDVTIN